MMNTQGSDWTPAFILLGCAYPQTPVGCGERVENSVPVGDSAPHVTVNLVTDQEIRVR